MKKTSPQTVALTCHPAHPTGTVRSLTASARMGGAGKLAVRFELDADMTRVVMPTGRAPARADGLWRHTCFELFVALPDSEAYFEMNFSPSGEWAMYGFVGLSPWHDAHRRTQAAAYCRATDAARPDPRSDHLPRRIAEAETGCAIACRRSRRHRRTE